MVVGSPDRERLAGELGVAVVLEQVDAVATDLQRPGSARVLVDYRRALDRCIGEERRKIGATLGFAPRR